MTPAQVVEAQKLAREWKPKTWEELSQQNQNYGEEMCLKWETNKYVPCKNLETNSIKVETTDPAVLDHCRSKWGSEYSMLNRCIEREAPAFKALEAME